VRSDSEFPGPQRVADPGVKGASGVTACFRSPSRPVAWNIPPPRHAERRRNRITPLSMISQTQPRQQGECRHSGWSSSAESRGCASRFDDLAKCAPRRLARFAIRQTLSAGGWSSLSLSLFSPPESASSSSSPSLSPPLLPPRLPLPPPSVSLAVALALSPSTSPLPLSQALGSRPPHYMSQIEFTPGQGRKCRQRVRPSQLIKSFSASAEGVLFTEY
jgi:hypothetical protein